MDTTLDVKLGSLSMAPEASKPITRTARSRLSKIDMKIVNLSIIHGPTDATIKVDDSAPSFPYQALDNSKLEIRVVILKAGATDAPMECTLEHAATKKGSRPSYRALSYTWGPPEILKTISLDGVEVQVRENLWQALYHLRSETTDLRIWIDAICINQNDVIERNRQVQRMSAIYGLAEEVLVWLGQESDDSQKAISFIEHNFNYQRGKLQTNFSFGPNFESDLQAVENLTGREYWHRIWIIQEIFRARKITVVCGPQEFQWTSLSSFFRQGRRYLESEAGAFSVRLERLCSTSAAKLTEHRASQELNLEELLTTYKGSLCTDPRDKVYSLLGLARRKLRPESTKRLPEKWLAVDYSKSALYIFQALIWMYYEETTATIHPCLRVRWMRSIQEVLCSNGPSFESLGTHVALPPNSFIPCRGVSLSAWNGENHPLMLPLMGPKWSPENEGHDTIITWHDQLPGSNFQSNARLKQILASFGRDDLARLAPFEKRLFDPKLKDQHTLFTPNESNGQQVRVCMTRDGQQFLFTGCDITPTDRIIYFYGSDVVLIKEEDSGHILGRALPFWSYQDQWRHDRSRYAVFDEGWKEMAERPDLEIVGLSVQEWQILTW